MVRLTNKVKGMIVIITHQISCLRLSCSVFTDRADRKIGRPQSSLDLKPPFNFSSPRNQNKAKCRELMGSRIGRKIEFNKNDLLAPIDINVLTRELLTEI